MTIVTFAALFVMTLYLLTSLTALHAAALPLMHALRLADKHSPSGSPNHPDAEDKRRLRPR